MLSAYTACTESTNYILIMSLHIEHLTDTVKIKSLSVDIFTCEV